MRDGGDGPRLSRTEWLAVSIGIQDALRCGCGDPPDAHSLTSRLKRVSRALTGIEAPRPLADPRLEALRRFVCATRRQGGANDYAPALLEHGFKPAQVEAIALLSDRLR